MSTATAASLVGLALVDSTSFGTLLIPVWLLLAPGRTRWGRVLLYLGTVAVFYLALGVALSAGAGPLLPEHREHHGQVLETSIRPQPVSVGERDLHRATVGQAVSERASSCLASVFGSIAR